MVNLQFPRHTENFPYIPSTNSHLELQASICNCPLHLSQDQHICNACTKNQAPVIWEFSLAPRKKLRRKRPRPHICKVISHWHTLVCLTPLVTLWRITTPDFSGCLMHSLKLTSQSPYQLTRNWTAFAHAQICQWMCSSLYFHRQLKINSYTSLNFQVVRCIYMLSKHQSLPLSNIFFSS